MLAECVLMRIFFFNLVWNLVSSFILKSHIFFSSGASSFIIILIISSLQVWPYTPPGMTVSSESNRLNKFSFSSFYFFVFLLYIFWGILTLPLKSVTHSSIFSTIPSIFYIDDSIFFFLTIFHSTQSLMWISIGDGWVWLFLRQGPGAFIYVGGACWKANPIGMLMGQVGRQPWDTYTCPHEELSFLGGGWERFGGIASSPPLRVSRHSPEPSCPLCRPSLQSHDLLQDSPPGLAQLVPSPELL